MKLASLDLPELGREEVWETQMGMVDSGSSVTSLSLYVYRILRGGIITQQRKPVDELPLELPLLIVLVALYVYIDRALVYYVYYIP